MVLDSDQFKIETGKVIVSDPCFPRGTWCQVEITNLKKGVWEVIPSYTSNEDRVTQLIVYHKEHRYPTDRTDWELLSKTIGVDSGMAGIFDSLSYQNEDHVPSAYSENRWFQYCCNSLENLVATIENGVVVRSGYGDGCYELYGVFQGNQTIGLKLIFIDDEDYDDEE